MQRALTNAWAAATPPLMDDLTYTLHRLEACVRLRTWESLETDWLEIKPVPASGNAWDSIAESVGAFLNTRGGSVILGVKDEQKPHRHFVFTGYTEDQSGNLSALRRKFHDARNHPQDISECLLVEVRPFDQGQIAIIKVRPLPEDRKYCFLRGEARERIADRDEKIPVHRVEEQEERKREMENFRELKPVLEAGLGDLDLQRINELVLLINQGQPRPIETIKSRLEEAVPFLEKKRFLRRSGEVTTLGMLVCGSQPEDHLLFRCQLDCFFLDVPNLVAQDKKTFRGTILSLMEAAHGWTLRNIMTGVSMRGGGSLQPEYPEKLIRESVNNALAHRDYALNRPVQITIKPGQALLIRNPGQLPHELVFECLEGGIPVRRIFPNPRARNPRLADILKHHNKFEGKGIGMADLVSFALSNETGVPHYLFHSPEELSLCIMAGRTLDEESRLWLQLMDGFILHRTGERLLTKEHQTVLAYLMKSEQDNRRGLYTLALTPGNNHFAVTEDLRTWGLIELHPGSDRFREVFVVCRDLMTRDLTPELRKLFGADFDTLNALSQALLNAIALAEKYSRAGGLNARAAGRVMRILSPGEFKEREEESFFRTVRKATESLAPALTGDGDPGQWIQTPEKMLKRQGTSTRPLFRLNREFQRSFL